MRKTKNKRKKRKQARKARITNVSILSTMVLLSGAVIGYLTQGSYARGEPGPEPMGITNAVVYNSEFNEKIGELAQQTLVKNLIKTIKKSQEHYASNFNFDDDASLQKYVSKDHPLSDPHYIPKDLVTIASDFIINKVKKPQLRAPARIALEDLAKAFYEKFNKKLYLISAYRSYEQQENLLKRGCSKQRCAEPGTSEHQLGLAVDIHTSYIQGKKTGIPKSSKYYKRLSDNAHKYGFHNTYQKGVHTDGQMAEGRHWRYISIPVATFLYKNNMTIGEYFALQTQQ